MRAEKNAPTVIRHPGPWIGPDADLARACAMAAIEAYGEFDAETHQRVLKDGIWNDHVSVQAALAAIHHRNAERAELVRVFRGLLNAAKDVEIGRGVHNDRSPGGAARIEGPVWRQLADAMSAARATLAKIDRG